MDNFELKINEGDKKVGKKTIPEQKYTIVKSNDLIEARYRLSLRVEAILWLLTQIRPEDGF